MTAGVASAEITFSGKGEAGVYRTAPTAAAAAVAGRLTTTTNNTTVTAANSTNNAKTRASDHVEYVDGVLTTVKSTRTAGIGAITTATVAANARVNTSVEYWTQDVADKAAELAALETTLATLAAATTKQNLDTAINNVAAAKADLARSKAVLANMSGTAAVAKGATPKLKAYSGYDFDVALSGASDNGMTFAMGFDMGAGHIADQDDDRAMDAQGGSIATDELTITYLVTRLVSVTTTSTTYMMTHKMVTSL